MPNFNFLKGSDGKIDVGSAIGFVLSVAVAVAIASRVPFVKKLV